VHGWGTRLQAGRSRAVFPVRPLDFSVYAILPAAAWPWGRQPIWVPGIFLGLRGCPACRADSQSGVCEPIIQKMWKLCYQNRMSLHGMLQGWLNMLTFCAQTQDNLLVPIFPYAYSFYHRILFGNLPKCNTHCEFFVMGLFLQWKVVSPTPNPQAWRPTPCRLPVVA
jgi:hypothetical protein